MARAMNWTRYDRLKGQGHSERDIADALGIPRTTLRRALAQRQGLPRRPESGGPPAPVQSPVQPIDTGAVSSVATGAVQGLDTGAVQRLDRLEAEVQGLTTLVQALIERLDKPRHDLRYTHVHVS
jgi:hypothetical protein